MNCDIWRYNSPKGYFDSRGKIAISFSFCFFKETMQIVSATSDIILKLIVWYQFRINSKALSVIETLSIINQWYKINNYLTLITFK